MKKIKVAIDGYSGTGKSSTARVVAEQLKYMYIDSGAMYRAVTYHVIQNKINLSDLDAMIVAIRSMSLRFDESDHSCIYLNNQLLKNQIRTPEVNQHVSKVAAITEIRREMVRQQKEFGKEGGIVMDGRDIGTMVLPDAELKVFMIASVEVRAKRRLMELKEQGIDSDLESIKENLQERDRIDSTRREGPLRKATDAMEIDSTDLTFDEQVRLIVTEANKLIHDN